LQIRPNNIKHVPLHFNIVHKVTPLNKNEMHRHKLAINFCAYDVFCVTLD